MDSLGLKYKEGKGEARSMAKVDIQLADVMARRNLLTIQVDFHLPNQFILNTQERRRAPPPVMIHRGVISTWSA